MTTVVFTATDEVQVHAEVTCILQTCRQWPALLATHNANGTETETTPRCGQRMQMIGPGPAETEQRIQTLLASSPEIGQQFEVFVAGKFWIDQIESAGQRYGMPEARPFTPDRWLYNCDKVTLGETEFEVFHCPGHTPGHVVFYSPQISRAFVGDVLFAGSIGRTDFPQGNHQQLLDSITQRLWPMGDDTVFIPGHGPESTLGHERKSNPFVSSRHG